MRTDRSEKMYDINQHLDAIRTEFYALLDFDPEIIQSPERDSRRRELRNLLMELGHIAETI